MKLNKKLMLTIIIILSILILSISPLIRFSQFDSLWPDNTPYFHAKLTNQMLEQGYTTQDSLSQGSRYIGNPYYYFLVLLGKFISLNVLITLVPLILGIFTILLLYLILVKTEIDKELIFLTLLIFILSPLFIYSYTVSNVTVFILFLDLMAFYLLLKENKYLDILAIILLSMVTITHLVHFLIMMAWLFAYFFKKNLKRFAQIAIILSIVAVVYYGPLVYYHGIPESAQFQKLNLIESTITILGSSLGFSFMVVLLFIIGFVLSWQHKKDYFSLYVMTAALMLLSVVVDEAKIYLNIFISFFTSIALFALINRKWKLSLIRNLTLLSIICGILFSTVIYLNTISLSDPTPAIRYSLYWLQDHSNKEDAILSDYQNGFWIEYFAERSVILDSNFYYVPKLNERFYDINKTWYSVNLKDTEKILNKYNIRYIWIDPEMKNRLWTRREQGLLFLLTDNETFKKVYTNNSIEIWEYLK